MDQGNKNKRTSENENTLNNEDINDHHSLIDIDPISYMSDFIIQISKNITKGRGLSQRGVNALFLFILTGSLLYQHTQFPKNITDFFGLYIVPFFFVLYFVVDFSKNIPTINNFFVKLFKRSDFAYYNIMNDSISLNNLEYYLKILPFSSEQIMNLIRHLLESNQLSPKVQTSLMHNNALYEIESSNYMKNVLLDYNFKPKEVCMFLKKMAKRLDPDYLDKIIEKYGAFPSVQFCIGHFHQYKKADSDSFFRYGYEFAFKKQPYIEIGMVVILVWSFVSFTMLLLSILCLVMGTRTPEFVGSIIGSVTSEFIGSRVSEAFIDPQNIYGLSTLTLLGVPAFILGTLGPNQGINKLIYRAKNQFEISISEYLQGKKCSGTNIIRDDIINDLKDAFD
ncbi:hypothetical protein BGV40_11025 [Methanosarcina sp. Ant1]|nr:hypothetical protein BGV40_11025 [Methanosarcina sp. Ant1]